MNDYKYNLKCNIIYIVGYDLDFLDRRHCFENGLILSLPYKTFK